MKYFKNLLLFILPILTLFIFAFESKEVVDADVEEIKELIIS